MTSIDNNSLLEASSGFDNVFGAGRGSGDKDHYRDLHLLLGDGNKQFAAMTNLQTELSVEVGQGDIRRPLLILNGRTLTKEQWDNAYIFSTIEKVATFRFRTLEDSFDASLGSLYAALHNTAKPETGAYYSSRQWLDVRMREETMRQITQALSEGKLANQKQLEALLPEFSPAYFASENGFHFAQVIGRAISQDYKRVGYSSLLRAHGIEDTTPMRWEDLQTIIATVLGYDLPNFEKVTLDKLMIYHFTDAQDLYRRAKESTAV